MEDGVHSGKTELKRKRLVILVIDKNNEKKRRETGRRERRDAGEVGRERGRE